MLQSPTGTLAVIAAINLAVLCATGCGEKDEPGAGDVRAAEERPSTTEGKQPDQPPQGHVTIEEVKRGTREEIPRVIEAVLASADSLAACRLFVTPRYVNAAFGSVVGCIESTGPESAARSVEVKGIAISGDRAKAIAIPDGGPSDGERITVRLVLQRGGWKVDSLRSNVPVGP